MTGPSIVVTASVARLAMRSVEVGSAVSGHQQT